MSDRNNMRWREGYQAYGTTMGNPYKPSTEDNNMWAKGWHAAQDDEEEYDRKHNPHHHDRY